jgi:phosphoserine aminotransferase
MEKINVLKSSLIYDYIDASDFYNNPVAPDNRSRMNIPFTLRDSALDAEFLKQAQENGLLQLKGHKLIGGMRASIYNAMPLEGVQTLVEFMRQFERAHG